MNQKNNHFTTHTKNDYFIIVSLDINNLAGGFDR